MTKNPFLVNKIIEDKPNAPTNNIFSVSTAKPAESANNVFSTSGMKTTNTANSLFTASTTKAFPSSLSSTTNKTYNIFQKSNTAKSTENEVGNGLFSLANTVTLHAQSAGDSSNLFSATKSVRQVFEMPEDPLKRKAFLFLNKFESDVSFKVENEEFPAHRHILSEKCIFFKKVFASGFLESHSSVIEIKFMKASLFKAFLEYVYLGETVMNEELALDLLDLGEQYMIDDLKEACANCLPKVLRYESCIKIFEAACLYGLEPLKKQTLSFFQMNIDRLVERKDFGDLPRASYLHLLKIYWNKNPLLGPPLSKLLK